MLTRSGAKIEDVLQAQDDLSKTLQGVYAQMGVFSDAFEQLRTEIKLLDNRAETAARDSANAARDAAQIHAANEEIKPRLQAIVDLLDMLLKMENARAQNNETASRLTAIEKKMTDLNARGDAARRLLQEMKAQSENERLAQPPAASAPREERIAWFEQVSGALREFAETGGNAALFARALKAHLSDLCRLADEIAARDTASWCQSSALDELNRRLFAVDLAVRWEDAVAHLPATRRARLRLLETAVLQWRLAVREELALRHGIAPLDIVPHETRFDATRHESSDYYTRPTADKELNNVILSVEKLGFAQKPSGGFAPRVLRRAVVTRWVWQENAAPDEPPAASAEAAPDEPNEQRSEVLPPEISLEIAPDADSAPVALNDATESGATPIEAGGMENEAQKETEESGTAPTEAKREEFGATYGVTDF